MLLLEDKNENSSICYFDSSNILACKFNSPTKQMAIIFKGGQQYVYEDITNYTFQRFKVSDSQGKHFRENILNRFKYQKVEGKINTSEIEKIIEDLKTKRDKLND